MKSSNSAASRTLKKFYVGEPFDTIEFIQTVPGASANILGTAPPNRLRLTRLTVLEFSDGFLSLVGLHVGLCAKLLDPSLRSWIVSVPLEFPEDRSLKTSVRWLIGSGFLEDAESPTNDETFQRWSKTDLAFHLSAREGRLNVPRGYRNEHRGDKHHGEPLRPRGINHSSNDRSSARNLDRVSLASSVALRTSKPTKGAGNLSIGDLQALFSNATGFCGPNESIHRAYPSAGGIYSIDCFVVSHCVMGLSRGLYFFDPYADEFSLIAEHSSLTESLLKRAARCIGSESLPSALAVLGCDFCKAFSRYRGYSYANVLKEAGCIIQNLALVSAALNLSGVPLGVGNTEVFSRAVQRSFIDYGSIAEFSILGAR